MNEHTDSQTLLGEFARHRSESAFAALVRRFLPMVHATASRRCNGATELVDDICQTVFIDLARKAHRIPVGFDPGRWLHRHTLYVSSTVIRSDTRRRLRESALAELPTGPDPGSDWHRLAPVLDEVLMELPPAGRDPVILRFLEELSFAEIGRRLGIQENAARMRVERALEQLSRNLIRRGIRSSAEALGALLTLHASSPLPLGLETRIVAAVAALPAASLSVPTLWGAFQGLVSPPAVGWVALVGLGVSLLWQHQAIETLRSEKRVLGNQLEVLRAASPSSGESASKDADAARRADADRMELLRLRGELARLRTLPTGPAVVPRPVPPESDTFEGARWEARPSLGLKDALFTSAWAWKDRAVVLVFRPVEDADGGALRYQSSVVQAPVELLERHGLLAERPSSTQVLPGDDADRLLEALRQEGAEVARTEPTLPGAEGDVRVGYTDTDHDQVLNVILSPGAAADGQLELGIQAERKELTPEELEIRDEPDPDRARELRERLQAAQPPRGP